MGEEGGSGAPVRRSKREHHPTAKAAALEASASAVSSSGASAGSTRRSQRHAKATASRGDAASKEGDGSLGSSRRAGLRRSTRSLSPASPTHAHPHSPVRVEVTPRASSPAMPARAAAVVPAAAEASPGPPSRQRRRYRAGSSSGATSGASSTAGATQGEGTRADAKEGKVLGRYSSHECALLCEVVLMQLRRRALKPSVLEEEQSPAHIRWETVAKRMASQHHVVVAAREWQKLWKFLAYGEKPSDSDDGKHGALELLPDSDVEELERTPQETNVRLAGVQARDAKASIESNTTAEAAVETPEAPMEPTQPEVTATATSSADSAQEEAKETLSKQQDESIRLYPSYLQPVGVPTAWGTPFGPKDALPLTYVASRFLKKKPPTQLPTALAAASGASSLPAGDLEADGKPKGKRKRKAAAKSVGEAGKKKAAKETPGTPRVFTPSSTPPPVAKRARSELEFFALRQQTLASSTQGGPQQPAESELKQQFQQAAVEIRQECQQLAVLDQERFNRELLRRRIWHKAMGSSHTPSPKPSPSVTAATEPKPGGGDTPSVGGAGHGPSAALLAHAAAAAVAGAVAESKAAREMRAAPASTSQPKADTGVVATPTERG